MAKTAVAQSPRSAAARIPSAAAPSCDWEPSSSQLADEQLPRVGAAGVAAPEPASLPDDLVQLLRSLVRPLRDETLSVEARAARCVAGLERMLALGTEAEMRAACVALEAAALTDDGMLTACHAATRPDVSARSAAAFASEAVLPRLRGLSAPASRTLFAALLALLAQHPRAVVDRLVLPLMWGGGAAEEAAAGGTLTASQSEVLSRLLKELPLPLLSQLLDDFLAGEGGDPTPWTEPQAQLLQVVLARKPALEPASVSALVLQADANLDGLRASPKFANLVFTLVKSHGAALRPHLPAMRRLSERLVGLLRKTTLAALTKLEAAPS